MGVPLDLLIYIHRPINIDTNGLENSPLNDSNIHAHHFLVALYQLMRSSYTSGRDILNDYAGNLGYDFVKIGNLLASRLVLLLILCSCRGCRWLVEQPEGSTLPHTKRFKEFLGMTKVSWIYVFYSGACVHACVQIVHVQFCIWQLTCLPHRFGWELLTETRLKGIAYGQMTKGSWKRSTLLGGIWPVQPCDPCLGTPLWRSTTTNMANWDEWESLPNSKPASV